MSENNRASVYVHINLINGKKYFGITTMDPPEKRWRNGNGYIRNAHFANAIKKYSWDNFAHYVLYRDIPIKIAKNIEEMLIQEHFSHDPRFGYNKTYGGELEIPSEETREKMSKVRSEVMKEHPENWINPPKPIEALDPESGQRALYFKSTMDAQRDGFNSGHISDCCKSRRKTHAGLVWRYVEEVNKDDTNSGQ